MRNVAEVVDRITYHIHDPAQGSFTNWNGDWSAGIDGFHSAHHAVGGQHRDGAHAAFTQVLLYFGDHIDRVGHVKAFGSYAQRLVNRRQIVFSKLDVHHRANNLHDATNVSICAISIGRSHICSVNSFE